MKYVLIIIAMIIVSPFVYTTTYYYIEIKPQSHFFKQRLALYDNSDSYYSVVKVMAENEEGKDGMARYVSHVIALENADSNFRGVWHLFGLHWHFWISILYTDDEIYRLWLAIAPYGKGRGMNEAANFYFQQSLSSLTCYQLAELVVMVRAPSIFKPGSERSAQRIREHMVDKSCSS